MEDYLGSCLAHQTVVEHSWPNLSEVSPDDTSLYSASLQATLAKSDETLV